MRSTPLHVKASHWKSTLSALARSRWFHTWTGLLTNMASVSKYITHCTLAGNTDSAYVSIRTNERAVGAHAWVRARALPRARARTLVAEISIPLTDPTLLPHAHLVAVHCIAHGAAIGDFGGYVSKQVRLPRRCPCAHVDEVQLEAHGEERAFERARHQLLALALERAIPRGCRARARHLLTRRVDRGAVTHNEQFYRGTPREVGEQAFQERVELQRQSGALHAHEHCDGLAVRTRSRLLL